MRVSLAIPLVCIVLAGVSCPPDPTKLPRADLADVKFWACQVHGLTEADAVTDLANSRYDMLVLDPTRTDLSSQETASFDAAAMVQRLKASVGHDGAHRKLLLAYLNIGEAEDWRWYWTWSRQWPEGQPRPSAWPSYIIKRDPEGWTGDYPVAYWDPAWKDIVINGVADSGQPYNSALDEVLVDGFDGVYLNWVEAFEDTDVYAAAHAAGKDPAAEMIAFIREIREYATLRGRSDFIIVQQNAATLIEGHPELVAPPRAIDAIAHEGIWYYGDATDDWSDPDGYDIETEELLTDYYVGYLDQFRQAGLPVFDCEYALQHAASAYARANACGFTPYVTRTSLSRLTTILAPGY